MKYILIVITFCFFVSCNDSKTSKHYMDIDLAIHKNDISSVKAYVESRDPNSPNLLNENLLHRAAFLGRYSIVDFLIKAGGDLNMPDNDGNTPLHIIAKKFNNLSLPGDHVGVLELLLSSGADYTVKNKKNETPLDLYKLYGREDLKGILLKP